MHPRHPAGFAVPPARCSPPRPLRPWPCCRTGCRFCGWSCPFSSLQRLFSRHPLSRRRGRSAG
ncbi:MAG: 4Fe-4S binding protein [Subdoligranulum sp.]|nr:4Fe-4S binding protein [Subdoligranulum sp.]